jgi:NAD(P)-dependent dehydrogenase (short-subunit alcohol dehydrogenase family)
MTQPKIAIVTGAGTGIGKAAALALLNDGWHVALAGRREQPLKELAQESGRASQCLVLPTDVANPDAVKALFAETAKAWGRVDLLFNNAGVGAPPVPLDELTIEQWRNVVDINLNGMFYCLQQAFAIMKKTAAHGWSHHQQWVHFCLRAAPELDCLHLYQTCCDWIDQNRSIGWPCFLDCCGTN